MPSSALHAATMFVLPGVLWFLLFVGTIACAHLHNKCTKAMDKKHTWLLWGDVAMLALAILSPISVLT